MFKQKSSISKEAFYNVSYNNSKGEIETVAIPGDMILLTENVEKAFEETMGISADKIVKYDLANKRNVTGKIIL